MDERLKEVQEYWDRRPCNIRHSAAKVGSAQFFEEARNRRYFVEPHIVGFAEFPRWKDRKVLEIGCGIGLDTFSFLEAGAQVTAVDISAQSMRVVRQLPARVRKSLRTYTANAEELSKKVPVSLYDLIYSFGVIHHTPHPERVIGEIRKYCGEGTVVKMMLYHRYSWKFFVEWLKHGKNFWRYSEAQGGSPVTHIYSLKDARKLVEDGGFEVTDLRVWHIFPYKVDKYINYEYKKVWYFWLMPRFLFDWLQSKIGAHLLITARLRNG